MIVAVLLWPERSYSWSSLSGLFWSSSIVSSRDANRRYCSSSALRCALERVRKPIKIIMAPANMPSIPNEISMRALNWQLRVASQSLSCPDSITQREHNRMKAPMAHHAKTELGVVFLARIVKSLVDSIAVLSARVLARFSGFGQRLFSSRTGPRTAGGSYVELVCRYFYINQSGDSRLVWQLGGGS